jgi:MarR family 2-MHQ and catechol resistance regulon transcriptional repressor
LLLEGYELVKQAYLLLDDGDNRFLSQYDLTQVQYFALARLQAGPKPLSQLSKELLCDPSNITRVAGILERKGLITRERDELDRRVVRAELTPEGAELISRLEQTHNDYIQLRMGALDAEERASLVSLLNKLSNGLREQLQPQSVT